MEEYYGYFVGLDDDEFSIEPIPPAYMPCAGEAPVEPTTVNAMSGKLGCQMLVYFGT
jgi:hypothetical protein